MEGQNPQDSMVYTNAMRYKVEKNLKEDSYQGQESQESKH